MSEKNISVQTLRRLPIYLHYLNSIKNDRDNISATAISNRFGLNDVQVRKDLGAISGNGKPKTGYSVQELIRDIENFLGCGNPTKAVLVGAGNLGKALLSYGGFNDYGLEIVAAFDSAAQADTINGKPVFSADKLASFCNENKITLGIITVPASQAQSVCDTLVAHGIKAVWNFAPTILRVPDGVIAENENLASSLAVLCQRLNGEGLE